MAQVLIRNWWALALRGVFGILFGLAAFLFPGITLGALILLFAIYAVLDGVFTIVAAMRAPSTVNAGALSCSRASQGLRPGYGRLCGPPPPPSCCCT